MSQLLWAQHRFPGSVLDEESGGFILKEAEWKRYRRRSARKAPAATRSRVPSGLEECGPPSVEAERLAKFTHEIGVRLLRLTTPVERKWFRVSGDSDFWRHTQGRADEHRTIWVRSANHDPEFLAEVVLHELRHIWRDGAFNTAAEERGCLEFGRKWAHAVYRAALSTDFDPSRVTLITGSHPQHVWPALKARRGDVAIGRDSARAWERGRDLWMELT